MSEPTVDRDPFEVRPASCAPGAWIWKLLFYNLRETLAAPERAKRVGHKEGWAQPADEQPR